MPPAKNLKDAYNSVTLDPLVSGDTRYVDCSIVRGGDDVVGTLACRIDISERPMAQLISGHRGCGKSTELLRLVNDLKNKKFLVVYFAADEDLDIGDLAYTDLLMAIIKRLVRTLEDEGIQIDRRLEKSITTWFAEVIYKEEKEKEISSILKADLELGVSTPTLMSLPLFAKILAKITGQVKTSKKIREEVRSTLDPQVSQFIDRINEFIQAALPEIKKKRYRDLVLVIDNLDRIVLRVLEASTGRTTHDALFLDHAEQLKALDVNVIYTTPISMFYSTKATQLTGAFPNYAILPMIKVQEEDGSRCDDGVNLLCKVAEERIDTNQLFAEGVVSYLAEKSGGMLRDFIRMLAYTIEMAQASGGKIPIDQKLAEKAFKRLVNEYGRMVKEEHFTLLANVANCKRIGKDSLHQEMLYNLSVLEYMNGECWYNVHPAIRELPEFNDACECQKRDSLTRGNS